VRYDPHACTCLHDQRGDGRFGGGKTIFNDPDKGRPEKNP
jgi:hypothetical protein